MAPQVPQAPHANGVHAIVANETLLRIAERELSDALFLRERPIAGLCSQPSRVPYSALDRAVHVLCAEAHRLDLRAEEMLIALKQAWSHLATTRARQLGDRDGDVLRDVVTASIEVYFDGRSRTLKDGS